MGADIAAVDRAVAHFEAVYNKDRFVASLDIHFLLIEQVLEGVIGNVVLDPLDFVFPL